jgi:hypothetical protein
MFGDISKEIELVNVMSIRKGDIVIFKCKKELSEAPYDVLQSKLVDIENRIIEQNKDLEKGDFNILLIDENIESMNSYNREKLRKLLFGIE